MAQFTLTIPDQVVNRVLTAICTQYNYDPNSGLTPAQFAKQVLSNFVRATVQDYEGQLAIQQAQANTQASVGTISIT